MFRNKEIYVVCFFMEGRDAEKYLETIKERFGGNNASIINTIEMLEKSDIEKKLGKKERTNNKFLILLSDYCKEIDDEINDLGWNKIDDYIWFGNKIFLKKCRDYFDIYGNKVIGFVNDLDRLTISAGSEVSIRENTYLSSTLNIECSWLSNISISDNVMIGEEANILVENGSRLIIGSNVRIRRNVKIVCANNSMIEIGKDVTIDDGVYIHATRGGTVFIGEGTKIARMTDIRSGSSHFECGKGCLISYGVIIRSYNGHSTIDTKSAEIICTKDFAKIEDHVWIGCGSFVFPGAQISKDCIVGANSFVSKYFPPRTMIVGNPGRIIRENITWSEKTALSDIEMNNIICECY